MQAHTHLKSKGFSASDSHEREKKWNKYGLVNEPSGHQWIYNELTEKQGLARKSCKILYLNGSIFWFLWFVIIIVFMSGPTPPRHVHGVLTICNLRKQTPTLLFCIEKAHSHAPVCMNSFFVCTPCRVITYLVCRVISYNDMKVISTHKARFWKLTLLLRNFTPFPCHL